MRQRTDGWMNDLGCYISSTVFQLYMYQDNDEVIMEGCVQLNLVYGQKDFRLKPGSNPGPPDQHFTY